MNLETGITLLCVLFAIATAFLHYVEGTALAVIVKIVMCIIAISGGFLLIRAEIEKQRRENRKEAINVDAIDWRSTKDLFRAAYHSSGGVSQRGGIIQQLEEIEGALQQLEGCDISEIPAIARYVHENFCGGMSAFLYLIDGEDDREDCIKILRRKRASLLLALWDLVGTLVLWQRKNREQTRRGEGD